MESKEETQKIPYLKIVVVGDYKSGKTTFLLRFSTGKLPEEYIPTVFPNTEKEYEIDGKTYRLALWDTSGQHDYDKIRPLSYPATKCFIVCLPVVELKSISGNLKDGIIKEIKHHCPNTPFIIVGTKCDLRDDQKFLKENKNDIQKIITKEDGEKFAKDVGAYSYVECSSHTGDHVQDCVYETVNAINNTKDSEKKGCLIN